MKEAALEQNADQEQPFQVKISNLPKDFINQEFREYIIGTFKIIPKNISRVDKSTTVVELNDVASLNIVTDLINNRVWKGKRLNVVLVSPENRKRKIEDEGEIMAKKPVVTEEELIALQLPWSHVTYALQEDLVYREAVVLSQFVHVQQCGKNPKLAGWAEKALEENGGTLLKIDRPIMAADNVAGYRSKFIFDVGKDIEGNAVVGLSLPETENRPACYLAVEPGDKLIHLPYSMKLTAQTFQRFLRETDKSPLAKKLHSKSWQKLRVITTAGGVMIIVGMYAKGLPDAVISEAKTCVNEYFMNGAGSNCNIVSLYGHIGRKRKLSRYKRLVYHSDDDMTLIAGRDSVQESINGLTYVITPFTPLKHSPPMMEKILDAVVELANPPPDAVAVTICGWPNAVSFALVKKCSMTYSLETQPMLVNDVEKTRAINNIDNMEIIYGKFDEELEKLLKKVSSKPVVLIMGLPRARVITSKISALLRAQPNIVRIVGICAEHKCGVKCWMDFLSDPEGKDADGIYHAGHPFVLVRAVPIDTNPGSHDCSIVGLAERVDPSKYPSPTKPIPKIVPLSTPEQTEKAPHPVPPKNLKPLMSQRVPERPPRIGRPPAAWQSPARPTSGFRLPYLAAPEPFIRRPGPPAPPLLLPRPAPMFSMPMEDPYDCPTSYIEEEGRTRLYYERRIAELERLKMVKASYARRVADLEDEVGVSGDIALDTWNYGPTLSNNSRFGGRAGDNFGFIGSNSARGGMTGGGRGLFPKRGLGAEPMSPLRGRGSLVAGSQPGRRDFNRGRGATSPPQRGRGIFGSRGRANSAGLFPAKRGRVAEPRGYVGGPTGDFRYGDGFGGYGDGEVQMDWRSFEGPEMYGRGRGAGGSRQLFPSSRAQAGGWGPSHW